MNDYTDPETQEVIEYWESYVNFQREKLAEYADQLQDVIDELGLVEAGVNPFDPMFKLENIPADAIDILEREFGEDLRATESAIRDASNDARKDKPKKQRRMMQRI